MKLTIGTLLFLAPAAWSQIAMPWSAVTCGGTGTPIQAGPYALRFVIGDPLSAAPVAAGQYTLSAGFGAVLEEGGPPPPPPCYPNCDRSTTPPILNVQDFGCFLNSFASGSSYANCDQSTTPPVLNVQDFGCFLNKFAAGCS